MSNPPLVANMAEFELDGWCIVSYAVGPRLRLAHYHGTNGVLGDSNVQQLISMLLYGLAGQVLMIHN